MFDLTIEEIDKIIDDEMQSIPDVYGELCSLSHKKGALYMAHSIKRRLNNDFQNKVDMVSAQMEEQYETTD